MVYLIVSVFVWTTAAEKTLPQKIKIISCNHVKLQKAYLSPVFSLLCSAVNGFL